MKSVFNVVKKKHCFEIYLFGSKFTLYRWLHMILEIYLLLHYERIKDTLLRKFKISLPKESYYRLSGNVELVQVALKDILVPNGHHKVCSIVETETYKWFAEKTDNYDRFFVDGCIYFTKDGMLSKERMIALEESLIEKDGYDPSKSVVCLRKNNVLIDGLHRCAVLYHKYGGDYKIVVVREL